MKVGIVGNGAAGLSCAIRLAEEGINVVVFGGSPADTNSYRAQAGIALPILEGDSIESHVRDTLHVGRGVNDVGSVRKLIHSSIRAYGFLKECGISFEGNEVEAGHSFPRVFTIKNETGKHLTEALHRKALSAGVKFVPRFVTSLAVEGKTCFGVFLGQEFVPFDAVVVASGGYAGLFAFHSGTEFADGLLIGDAILKGARARSLEFVQFHPTSFVSGKRVILLSEALRGMGARLINSRGERFVDELAPRDIVAREIYMQIESGHRVFLDARRIDLRTHFPGLLSGLLREGIDPQREPVPVFPVAHYCIGGLAVDDGFRTDIEKLYAIGEAAETGLHGANRLASNSLLECIVSGILAAEAIIRDCPRGRKERNPIEPPLPSEDTGKAEVKEILWRHAGIVRDGKSLAEGLRKLEAVGADPRIKVVAAGVLKSALFREESRGVHFRKDFPREREEFSSRIVFDGRECWLEGKGQKEAR